MRTLFFLAVFTSFAFSHALHLFATQEGDRVEIYSYFYKNSPCMECEVLISADGREILRTRTDKEGLASIKIPAKNFTIKIYGGAGHGAQMEFSAEDFTPQDSGDPENSTPQNSEPQNLDAAKNFASKARASKNIAPKASTPENKILSTSEPLQNSASQSISPKESPKSDIRSMAFQSQSAEAPKIALCLALIFGFFALMWLAKRARK